LEYGLFFVVLRCYAMQEKSEILLNDQHIKDS